MFWAIGSGFNTQTAENGLEEATQQCRNHGGVQQAQLDTLWTADWVVCRDGKTDTLD